MNKSTEYVLQGILSLYDDNFKDTLFHLWGNICGFIDLKKHTFAVDIAQRWGNYFTEEGSMIFLEVDERVS